MRCPTLLSGSSRSSTSRSLGQGHLGQDQRGQLRLADRLDELVGQLAPGGGQAGDELDRLGVMAELDQADQGVQPVRELVRLGPQRVGQPGHLVQRALERLGLGAVLEGHHPAELLVVAGDRHPVGDEHPVVVQHEQVAAGHLAGHHVGEPAGRQHVAELAAGELGRQAEQVAGRVVGQQHPAAGVVAEHRLPDAVQHRLPLLQQRGDLAELKAEGLPLQPAGQGERGEHADREDAEQVEDEASAGRRTARC